jgi:hypothetical protein
VQTLEAPADRSICFRSSSAIPASPLTFLYGLCRKALSVPLDDPLSVLDATGVANIDAIRGCQPCLVPVEAEIRHRHPTSPGGMAPAAWHVRSREAEQEASVAKIGADFFRPYTRASHRSRLDARASSKHSALIFSPRRRLRPHFARASWKRGPPSCGTCSTKHANSLRSANTPERGA